MNNYRAQITGPAWRDLNAIPARIAPASLAFIYGPLQDNPRRVGAPLDAPLQDLLGAHRGPYRVLYRIDDEARVVYVRRIAIRADAYYSGAARGTRG